MSLKTLVIGLDGATFDVIDPLIKDGRMNTLQKFINRGVSGPLQSTMPPVTGPAWHGLATGLTPAKTGIFDFVVRDGAKGFKFRVMNSGDYAGKAIWDYLSNLGVRVGVINYPCTYPPYAVNGFFVSAGIGSPDLGDYTQPKELTDEIKGFMGGERQINLKDPKYHNPETFIKDLNLMFDRHVEGVKYLLQKKEWDFCWVVFSETDWIQHMMWKYIDPSHPLYDNQKAKKYGELFKQFWSRVDKAISRLHDNIDDETNIIIVSDHGFGCCFKTFRVNAWLKQEGFFVGKKLGWTRYIARKRMRSQMKKIVDTFHLNNLFPKLINQARKATFSSTALPISSVNFKKSLAFDPVHIGTFAGIYINNELLNDESIRESTIKKISNRLMEFGKKKGIEIQIHRPEDLYKVRPEGSPDLIVRIDDGQVFIDKTFDGKVFEDSLPDRLSFMSGSHRMNGIFIAMGPSFKHAKIQDAQIWDVAPTLLHSMSIQIPSWMEGKTLTEALYSGKKLDNQHNNSASVNQTKEKHLSDSEENIIIQKLSDLGYF